MFISNFLYTTKNTTILTNCSIIKINLKIQNITNTNTTILTNNNTSYATAVAIGN